MKPRNSPASALLPPSRRMRKGIVGNSRKADMNVVNVKLQSKKNRGVKRGASGVDAESAVVMTNLLSPEIVRGRRAAGQTCMGRRESVPTTEDNARRSTPPLSTDSPFILRDAPTVGKHVSGTTA